MGFTIIEGKGMDTKTAKEIVNKLLEKNILSEDEKEAIHHLICDNFHTIENNWYLPDHLIKK